MTVRSIRHSVFVIRSATVTRRAALLYCGVATLVVPSVARFRGAGAACFAAAGTCVAAVTLAAAVRH
eukprot:4718447-Pleurochrysis_carterae.AAC.2